MIWFGTHAYKDTCWFHIFKSNLPETAESISHMRPAKSPYKSISGWTNQISNPANCYNSSSRRRGTGIRLLPGFLPLDSMCLPAWLTLFFCSDLKEFETKLEFGKKKSLEWLYVINVAEDVEGGGRKDLQTETSLMLLNGHLILKRQ